MKLNSVSHWWTWNVPLPLRISLFAILAFAPLFGWALARESWIILAVLAMTALVPVVIRWPVVSTFGLYALVVPFDSVRIFAEAGGTSLTRPIGILAAAVLGVAGLMERRLGRPPLAAVWWGLLILWAAATAAWAIDPEIVFWRLPTALSLFLLYLIAVLIRPSRRELLWVCVALVVGGAVAAGLGYSHGVEVTAEDTKARGTLAIGGQESNPNSLGSALILPFALAMGGVIGLRGTGQKLIATCFVGLISAGIFISMSRSAVIAVLMTISVFVYRMGLRRQIVVATVALLAVTAMMPARFYERVTGPFTGEDPTGSGRTEIWKVGLKALEGYGVFGAGLSNFNEAYIEYVGPSSRGAGAHNSYLMIGVDLGILGLVLMSAALGSHFFAAHRARKAGRGGVVLAAIEAGCVGVLAFGLFGDVIWKKYFWLAWILLTWATYCARQLDRASDTSGFSG